MVVQILVFLVVGYLHQISDELDGELHHLIMRSESLRLRSLVEICNVDHQYLEALMLDKGVLVLTKISHQLLPFLRVQLITDPLRQQLQQRDDPKRQFLVLHLQHQQLQQVRLDDVVVSEDKP